jgi:hypothetical protein
MAVDRQTGERLIANVPLSPVKEEDLEFLDDLEALVHVCERQNLMG